MDPGFLAPLIPIVAIIAVAAVKIARLRAETPSGNVPARLEALERNVHDLQQELAETQERLDFAERLLTKAAEERRIAGS
jgi:predicted  nucleic acid-binding Zn-ribbon protein